MVFLFGLFTTSYAGWVCVEKPADTKDYAIFVGSGKPYSECFFRKDSYYCCEDVPLAEELKVVFVSKDDIPITATYRLVFSEGEVTVVKAISGYSAVITISGREGTYLITEDIPKEYVEDAADLISDAFVVEPDPVIAWFATIGEDGFTTVSYRVKRGAVPETLPEVRLSECNFEIRRVKHSIVKEEGGPQYYLLYTFEVLLDGRRVVPSQYEARINGKSSVYQARPVDDTIEIIEPISPDTKRVKVEIEVGFDECRKTLVDEVEVKIERGLLSDPLILGGLVFLLVLILAWSLLRGSERRAS